MPSRVEEERKDFVLVVSVLVFRRQGAVFFSVHHSVARRPQRWALTPTNLTGHLNGPVFD